MTEQAAIPTEQDAWESSYPCNRCDYGGVSHPCPGPCPEYDEWVRKEPKKRRASQ
jgi:hypothetical protein